MSSLKCLVSYIAFHPDNYQGATGKSFEFKRLVEVPICIPSKDVVDFIQGFISNSAEKDAPYTADFKFSIQKIEVLVQTHCGLVRDKYEISYVEKWEQFYKIAERSSAPCERCMKRAGK